MGREIRKDSTDESTIIRILDDTDGTPEEAVEHDTSGIALWYRREGGTKQTITPVALAALDSAHADGGIEHVDDGYYRLDLPDAAVATGADGVMVGGTVTGMIVVGNYHPLVAFDPQDSVRMGMTSLPNAAADAAGGLPISDAGGLDMDSLSTHSAADVWSVATRALTDKAGFSLAADQSGVTIGTVTTNTDMRGTDNAFLASSAPTNFGDLTITATTGKVTVGTNDDKTGYSLAADQSGVTIGTVTTNTDMRGTDNAATAAELAKVPKSDGSVTWNATALASIESEANDALIAFWTSPATLVDLIWDEELTGATHNVPTSAGRRLRQLDAASIRSGTAQAGTANSITLDSGASATDEIYDGNIIVIVEGTGVGQARVIAEYNGTSKVATVDQAWVTNPDETSVFQIIANQTMEVTQHGIAQAGAASTITLNSLASSQDDIYNGQMIVIRTSNGAGQARLITDYNGTTKVATVSPAWEIQPTSASVYAIMPFGRSIVDGHTPQTGDSFARLGAPAGASVSADVASVYTDTQRVDALIENVTGDRFTEKALEAAPAGEGGGGGDCPTASEISTQVWNDAPSGKVEIEVTSPLGPDSRSLTIIAGDDYLVATEQEITISSDAWPNLTGASVTATIESADGSTVATGTGTVVTAGASGTQTVRVEFTAEETAKLNPASKNLTWGAVASLSGDAGEFTLRRGTVKCLPKVPS